MCEFSIAHNEVYGSGDNRQETVHWIRIVAFGKTAQLVAEHKHQGDEVFVEGSLTYSEWTDADGNQAHRSQGPSQQGPVRPPAHHQRRSRLTPPRRRSPATTPGVFPRRGPAPQRRGTGSTLAGPAGSSDSRPAGEPMLTSGECLLNVRELRELLETVPPDCEVGVLVLSPCGDVIDITATDVATIDATIADDGHRQRLWITGVGHSDTPAPTIVSWPCRCGAILAVSERDGWPREHIATSAVATGD